MPAYVRIAPSTVSGLGAFATCAIPRGSFLGCYRGERVTVSTGERMSDRRAEYMFAVADDAGRPRFFIDAHDPRRGNWTRYMNCARRSEEENVRAVTHRDDIRFYALRAIAKDDELLFDYGKEYAESLGVQRRRRADGVGCPTQKPQRPGC
jgi:SET domain-containing protein